MRAHSTSRQNQDGYNGSWPRGDNAIQGVWFGVRCRILIDVSAAGVPQTRLVAWWDDEAAWIGKGIFGAGVISAGKPEKAQWSSAERAKMAGSEIARGTSRRSTIASSHHVALLCLRFNR